MTSPAVERPPLAAALLFLATIGYWATTLLLGGTDLSPGISLMAGAGAWLAGVVALVGVVVSRGRWALRLGVGLVLGTVAVAAFTPNTTALAVGVLLSSVTAWFLFGGSMRAWIRKGRSIDAPPDSAIMLMLAFVLWPLVGAPMAGGILWWLLWAGPILAFVYGRAAVWGLWAARLLAPAIPLVAATGSGTLGWATATTIAVATTWFAWQGDTRLAVIPLTGSTSSSRPVAPDFMSLQHKESGDG